MASSNRAARLAAIKRKLAVGLGYDPDTVSGADAERLSHAALLQLQYEITSGKLIEGNGSVATDELIKLSEAVNNMLPPKAPQNITVEFVYAHEGKEATRRQAFRQLRTENERLEQRVRDLERQLRVMSAAPAPPPVQINAPPATPEAANVIPMPNQPRDSSSPWAGLAAAVSRSPYTGSGGVGVVDGERSMPVSGDPSMGAWYTKR
jgi:polyhydroxyalkanoate synthesis regulator phasin